MQTVINGIHSSYYANFGSLGFTFTLKFAITRTLALADTVVMADIRADAAHAHGHVTTQSTIQSSTQSIIQTTIDSTAHLISGLWNV